MILNPHEDGIVLSKHGYGLINGGLCHAPDPGPTRLTNPNRFRGVKPYAGTP